MLYNVHETALARDGTPLVRSKVRVDEVGKPLFQGGSPITEYVPYTYQYIISELLDVSDPIDTGEIKAKINEIQDVLWAATDKVELTVLQQALILERAGKYATVQSYGLISKFIEKRDKS